MDKELIEVIENLLNDYSIDEIMDVLCELTETNWIQVG